MPFARENQETATSRQLTFRHRPNDVCLRFVRGLAGSGDHSWVIFAVGFDWQAAGGRNSTASRGSWERRSLHWREQTVEIDKNGW